MACRTLGRFLLGSVVASTGVAAAYLTVALTPGPAMTYTRGDLAVVALADDAPGALFTDAELTPGRTIRRCVSIGFTGTGTGSEVRLIAQDLSGRLLPYLTATVAVGTGGGYAGCRGFSGITVYDGPLSGLAGGQAGRRAPGIATGWRPTGTGSRTFQVTVRVADDNAAQAKSAGATLRWALVAPDEGPSDPVATPTPGRRPTTPPPGTAPRRPTSAPASPSVDNTAGGSPQPGTPAVGSPAPGGPAVRSPAGADPSGADPSGTDPSSGDPSSADPAAGDPAAGRPGHSVAPAGDGTTPSRSPTTTDGGSVRYVVLAAVEGALVAIGATVGGPPSTVLASGTALVALLWLLLAYRRRRRDRA